MRNRMKRTNERAKEGGGEQRSNEMYGKWGWWIINKYGSCVNSQTAAYMIKLKNDKPTKETQEKKRNKKETVKCQKLFCFLHFGFAQFSLVWYEETRYL